MTRQSKIRAALAVVVALGALVALNSVYHFTGGYGRVVDGLISRNVAARGGADAWQSVNALRFAGQMDLGQGLSVPYVMEKKRPGMMCLEFAFDGETAIQCVNGDSGWKLLPFRGRNKPESMTETELQKLADTVSIDGVLLGAAVRGDKIKFLGKETVDGKTASKLQITLPGNILRWVYLDDESGLEIKLQHTMVVRGEERIVETVYSDWREVQGVLLSHRQDTQIEGDTDSQFVTVNKVDINPPIDDARFALPVAANAS